MKRSTATFIPYNMRPAKQAERRMLMDFLKCANEAGLKIADCRYVGMGGTMFYDFYLMHRFLGISKMVSLERNPDIFPRCEFNCPFDFVDVRNDDAAAFLAGDAGRSRTIYWFDYDDGFGADIVADIIALGTRLRVGGFAFVTVCGEPPGALQKLNNEQRLEYFQEHLEEFSVGLTADQFENAAFLRTIHGIILAAFQNAFAARTDGKFHPLFQVQYKDSISMITVGGCFATAADVKEIRRRMQVDLPFLLSRGPYRIRQLNLTERERALFDIAATKKRKNSKQGNTLRSLGFTERDFDAYRDLLRFLPRYHESII